jgi:hypothetical protein
MTIAGEPISYCGRSNERSDVRRNYLNLFPIFLFIPKFVLLSKVWVGKGSELIRNRRLPLGLIMLLISLGGAPTMPIR